MENKNQNEELEIQHRLYIMDEGINVSELPSEIKQAMRNFNAKLKKYEDTDDEATENDLFYELQQDDVSIADNILTWWEDKNSEEEEEVEEEEEEPKTASVKNQGKANGNNNQPAAKGNNDPKASETVVETPPEPTPTPTPAPAPISLEQKVRDLLKDNVISLKDLTDAIGEEPEYPEHIIGKLRLRKQYLKKFYEVV